MNLIPEIEFYYIFRNAKDVQNLWHAYAVAPKTEQELLQKYMPSKLWRLNNLYTIIGKLDGAIPFRMNRAQLKVYAKLLVHPRLIILKSRQQGVSTLYLVMFFDDLLTHSNLHCGLMAQDEDAAKTLLRKVKVLWNQLDPAIKESLNITLVADNTKEFTLSNGSSLFIRTSFRSTTLQRLHISELAKIANKDPIRAKETNTGTLQTIAPGNLVAIESTAEGHNMFKNKWDAAVLQYQRGQLAGKDFLPLFLSWLDDPSCNETVYQEMTIEANEYFTRIEKETKRVITQEQKNFWISQARELGLIDVLQEYPATAKDAFAASRDGTYWSRIYQQEVIDNDRRKANLYDPHLPIYVIQDLGRRDYYVLLFFQYFNDQIRIVDEYYNSGEDIRHYASVIRERAKMWDIKLVIFPHDGSVIDLSANNMTRVEIFNECGITNTFILNRSAVQSGIEAVRHYLRHIWIDEKCTYVEQCFLKYTKAWNETLQVWRDEPVKNGYQHGADAIRYMVQYVESYMEDRGETYDTGVVDGITL